MGQKQSHGRYITTYPDKRIIQNRYGIVFTVQQQDPKILLLNYNVDKVDNILALLAMATTVVDALMSYYCFKNIKKVYLKMKYLEVKVTEDEHGSLNYRALDEGEGSI